LIVINYAFVYAFEITFLLSPFKTNLTLKEIELEEISVYIDTNVY